MNKNATRFTKNGREGEDLSALCAKKARKENITSHPNRVSWRTKGGPESMTKDPPQEPNNTVHLALQEHKDLLIFLEPHLASFPSITFKLLDEDLASVALSSAILYKNANEKYMKTLKTHPLPNSIPRPDSKLQATNRFKKKPGFQSLVLKVDKQVVLF